MSWFKGNGPLKGEELISFVKDYKKMGRHNWETKIKLNGEGHSSLERQEMLINETVNEMGRITDRLALTIIDLTDKKDHAGDCLIYSILHNGNPEDGICNCGYGLQKRRKDGDISEMYSKELKLNFCNFQI